MYAGLCLNGPWKGRTLESGHKRTSVYVESEDPACALIIWYDYITIRYGGMDIGAWLAMDIV